MTRDEFMKHATEEIDSAFRGQKNRMMNLVEQAWAEGKRNAEMDRVEELGKEIIDYVKKSIIVPDLPQTKDIDWKDIDWKTLLNGMSNSFDKYPCKHCNNNPANGGSGICHCILGTSPIT